jgi:transglutaminase-like putative cysteine protease
MNTLNKEQMIEFEGSPSIKKTSAANAARLLTKKLKKGAKGSKAVKVTKTSPKPQKKKRGGVARRPKSYSGKVTAGSKIAIASRVSSSTKRKVVDDVLKLTRVIQKRLPAEVRRNMGRPALINRTGRFSNSVRLINLAQTSKGVAGTYTYRLNPYATFENLGEKQWPVGYNPKSLITKSIRSLAVQYTKQRLTRLRRT